ncbi:hypothetical protein [uncultured Desulfobacter sp.]|uniref:hypothetical protein n=1 Tax=uncultured Desulfobacter sp. TaxID=240139 RepID=UPI002AA8C856|nr:hypothetical protein [uncultured Desulfobacter sp.]
MEQRQKKRFGTIAVEKGFISKDDLADDLHIQTDENISKGQHRLLGRILMEQGLLTKEQVYQVLDAMNHEIR